jgi:hypothetical protein
VPVNFVLFGVQALLPLSSVKIYEAIRLRIGPTLVVAALAWVGIAAAVFVGLGRLRAGKAVWAIVGCGVLGLLPVVLLNKVSELYLYNSMPFVSMLVGAGLGKLVTDQRVRPARVVTALLVAALGVTHVLAVRSKVALMRDLGERSSVLLSQLDPYLDLVPANGLLLLVNPALGDVEYSVFTANGFNVLNTGFDRLYQLAGRHDFKILVRSRGELDETTELGTHVVALTLDPATNTVRPLR